MERVKFLLLAFATSLVSFILITALSSFEVFLTINLIAGADLSFREVVGAGALIAWLITTRS